MFKTRVKYDPTQNNFGNPESERQNNLFLHYQQPGYHAAVDEAHRPEFPFVCSFEFTNACNLNCVFCARQVMDRKNGVMPPELFDKIMAEFSQRNVFLKVNGYGENLLHPQALDFIRKIKQTNGLYFTTNATLIDDAVAECFVEHNVDVIQLSFQGVDQASYESQRQKSSWDTFFANVKRLIEIRGNAPFPYIHLSTTILDETAEQVEPFMEMAFDLGVDAVGVGRTDYDRVIADMIKDPQRKAEIDRFRERQTLNKVPDHTYLYRYCDINWDGVVVSSFFDFNKFVPVGDLTHQSMYEIWNHSPVLRALRLLESHRALLGFSQIREAVHLIEQAGVADQMDVFDTFFHAWNLGEKSYNT
jgi:MoaA/NifB/PqqE/SkfB family radical SAM enzyme